jgi:DNA-directed RNA polymerase subunit M/transcription elongation factor TFIIS
MKRKRGRPRIKNRNGKKVKTGYQAIKYPEVKPVKFLGYCNKCFCQVMKTDLESIRVFVCPSCGNRSQLNKLKKTRSATEDKPKSKKEYLENTLHVNYADHIGHEEPEPKDIKPQE